MRNKIRVCIALTAVFLTTSFRAQAQVTIGMDELPRKAALLDLKTQQEKGTVASVTDDKNVTSTSGGLLLPRVKLVNTQTLEPFIAKDDAEFVNNTNSLKEKLAGLMVYNISDDGLSLYPAVYTWNGASWVTSQVNEAVSSIMSQPKKFSFYETGTETAQPLEFKVDGEGSWTYQWYQVTSSNVHVRVGTPIGQAGTISGTGAASDRFTPSGVLKGTTKKAGNTGFYRFYCVAESSLGARLESDIAEVAVGCGAKNNAGEWISFMCFNLGADNNSTINSQKNYPMGSISNASDGVHTYIRDEEKLWGDLFQWGRIADGHEKRQSATVAFSTLKPADIVNGKQCTLTGIQTPWQQIGKSSSAYGKFITGSENWFPGAESSMDQLWRTSRFTNDPCAHYKDDGSYQAFWHEGTNQKNDSPACIDCGTGWRTPTQEEWGALYKGGITSGSNTLATANTWIWNNANGRGYEIKPDNATTTLFLPASGYRSGGNGALYNAGASGSYWSACVAGTLAYNLTFSSGNVLPAYPSNRASGFALRCVKN